MLIQIRPPVIHTFVFLAQSLELDQFELQYRGQIYDKKNQG